jgi:hypothetical protein
MGLRFEPLKGAVSVRHPGLHPGLIQMPPLWGYLQ